MLVSLRNYPFFYQYTDDYFLVQRNAKQIRRSVEIFWWKKKRNCKSERKVQSKWSKKVKYLSITFWVIECELSTQKWLERVYCALKISAALCTECCVGWLSKSSKKNDILAIFCLDSKFKELRKLKFVQKLGFILNNSRGGETLFLHVMQNLLFFAGKTLKRPKKWLI